MKNYYEILEVSQNASPEVIEKAHKALVKKYHPDLQPTDKKNDAENKIKEINEAYEVLSDINKKADFDRKLNDYKVKSQKMEESKNIINQKPVHTERSKQPDITAEAYNDAVNQAYNKAYNDAYINSLKNMGYTIKYEKTVLEKLKTIFYAIVTIIIFIVLCLILWQIPPIKNYFIDVYNNNQIFKVIVDFISNTFNSFLSLFKK